MRRLVMSFFILPKAFKMINQQARPGCIVSNSYRHKEGIKPQRRRCYLIFRQNKSEFRNTLGAIGPRTGRNGPILCSFICSKCITGLHLHAPGAMLVGITSEPGVNLCSDSPSPCRLFFPLLFPEQSDPDWNSASVSFLCACARACVRASTCG